MTMTLYSQLVPSSYSPFLVLLPNASLSLTGTHTHTHTHKGLTWALFPVFRLTILSHPTPPIPSYQDQFNSVTQSCPTLCNPMDAARQASQSFTNSWSYLKFMSIELVMPSNHLILCRPLLFLPSIFPSIRVFFKESILHIRWPKY